MTTKLLHISVIAVLAIAMMFVAGCTDTAPNATVTHKQVGDKVVITATGDATFKVNLDKGVNTLSFDSNGPSSVSITSVDADLNGEYEYVKFVDAMSMSKAKVHGEKTYTKFRGGTYEFRVLTLAEEPWTLTVK